ncbi:hypothetical protein [Streptomyces sp. NPDC096012]|uniref:hypothetical protein n=1 Tax=Streptomyces sp. NPDC096012 TaxID=3155684 RepID=UPI00336A9839
MIRRLTVPRFFPPPTSSRAPALLGVARLAYAGQPVEVAATAVVPMKDDDR